MPESSDVPVAVIGMGCRLPGGIDSPEGLWSALLRGDDLVTEFPKGRFDVDIDDFYDPEPGVPGRTVSKWGSFLDDVGGFDAEFFGIGEREAAAIDPQHRLLLETSWEAMEHAGLDPATLAGSMTGVFVGLTHDDYLLLAADAGTTLEGPYGFVGSNFSMASGRISYSLGVHGPAVTVDTACSSSLVAVHLACRSLIAGESDFAIAGGAAVIMEAVRKSAAGSAQGMLSPTGHCHAFDEAADGFVSGEGCAVVLLKRLPEALSDGDRVLAVLRGTAANQDGRTMHIAVPSRDAQVSVYRTALAAAGVDAGTIGMVEAHGTGTPVGDPIEYTSLAEVYGADGPCALGSLKTNFGHGQSASGAMGLMKAILAVQHGVVPRSLHFTRLPENLAAVRTELFVPQVTTSWPTNGQHPRRAAVSSYGMSGTNAHVVVEEAPAQCFTETALSGDLAPAAAADPLVFALSSTSADELRRTAGRLADWVTAHSDDVSTHDLGYTLARRRAHRPVRTAVIASTHAELVDALRDVTDGDTPYQAAVGQDDRGPVWVFSGQGGQWAGMGAGLLASEPAFAAAVAEVEPLIAHESGFSVTEAMSAAEMVTAIDQVQPTLFAMQTAFAAAMRAHGVQPGAVIGHSLGEVAAAVVAGGLSLADGVRVICRRSRLMARIAGSGAMASVELPAPQVLSELSARGVTDVVLSVISSPKSTVIGGTTEAVRDLVAGWERREVMAREVAVDVASHSPQVDPILDELIDALADLTPTRPEVPYYSATLYDPRDRPSWDGDYWADNLRHAVRFAAAVQAALEDGHRVFGELSPHPLLTHAVEQTARSIDAPLAALAALRRGQESPHGLLEFLADLHSAGAAVDFSVRYRRGRLVDAPLPTWTRRQLLLTRDAHEHAGHGGPAISVHPLLGAHVRLLEEPERHAWQGEVGTAALPWLADHQVNDLAVFPGAAYCEMALAAAHTVVGEAAEVRDVRFEQLLVLDADTPLSAVASVDAPGVVTFVVETDEQGVRARRAAAVLHATSDDEPAPATHDIAALRAEHPCRTEGADLRRLFAAVGISYGPAFTALAATHTAEGHAATVLAEVALPSAIRSQQTAFCVHPALLDACFQSVVAHPVVVTASAGGLMLPLGVRLLRAYGPARNAHYCYTRAAAAEGGGVEADLDVLDEHGAVLLAVRGLRMGSTGSGGAIPDRVVDERLLTVEWQPRELPDAELDSTDAGSWLVIHCDATDELATGVTNALKHQGAHCTTIAWHRHADHLADAERLRLELSVGAFAGVVVLTGSPSGTSEEQLAVRGQEYVRQLVRIARELSEVPGEPSRLYVVTRNAQPVVPDDAPNLEQGGLRGLMRVIEAEHPHLNATQIDLDDHTDAEHLVHQLMSGPEDDETAWRNGEWYVARLCPSPLRPEERRTTIVDHERAGMRLQIRTPGDLQSMEIAAFDRVPPGPGEIEVAVAASSVNFADVLVAFGMYPSFEGRLPRLGTDFAGVVTAVGSDVTRHRVGDHVGGMSANGCWGTFVTCDAHLAVTLPAGLRDDQAAAVTTAYGTAWYGLHELARIAAGDKVLIHSATGGVGQAALAMARSVGAEIYATAGSAQRRQRLRDMGIEHVYDSRSTEFAESIRRDTDGYGVDVVLNSLTGAAQRAGLELLTFGGRFIEIGKRDIYGDTRLGLFPFRRNISFHAVDFGLLAFSHPDTVQEVLNTVYRLIADGDLALPETTRYPLADAATVIRLMSGAGHTGKLVLELPPAGYSSVVLPPEQVHVFRPDGAYVITGGLGGLGLFLAERMAAAGCGRIVLNGRSEPTPEALAAIDRLRAAGVDILVECGDIADPDTANRVVALATGTGLPVRGVLHAAAVVEDATLTNITDELIERDWAPKVYGAWKLHRATATQPLDWFCLFSSAAALVGSPGQGAYAAANSWLDAFTYWRRAQGLPATTIAWGAWGEIGRGKALAEGADIAIDPVDGAYAFQSLLRHDRGYTGYAPIKNTPWLAAYARRSRFFEAFTTAEHTGTDAGKFRAELRALPRDEWPTRLRRLISDQLGLILRRSIDPDRPLAEYGVDSLGNLELRTRIETETGVRVTTTEITTVRELAGFLHDRLAGEYDAAQQPPDAASAPKHPANVPS